MELGVSHWRSHLSSGLIHQQYLVAVPKGDFESDVFVESNCSMWPRGMLVARLRSDRAIALRSALGLGIDLQDGNHLTGA
jgi:hypothetical protein